MSFPLAGRTRSLFPFHRWGGRLHHGQRRGRGFVVGGQLFLKEDTYEITSAYIHGNVNYNIYGIGIAAKLKLPLQQTGEGYIGEFLRRLWWKFFVGPRFLAGRSLLTVRPNDASNFPFLGDVGVHTNLTALGARLTRDTRLNHFYPVGGTFFTFTSDFFSQQLGSKYSFQSYKTKFDKYWSLSKNQVLGRRRGILTNSLSNFRPYRPL